VGDEDDKLDRVEALWLAIDRTLARSHAVIAESRALLQRCRPPPRTEPGEDASVRSD